MKSISLIACLITFFLVTGCAAPAASTKQDSIDPEPPAAQTDAPQEEPIPKEDSEPQSPIEPTPVVEQCPKLSCPKQSCPKLSCPNVSRDARLLTDKLYLGQVESITIKGINHAIDARIDTGATTTSIDAKNIERFERDGKSWIRFTIPARADHHDDIIVERPRKRRVLIKGEGQEKERRYVVELYITIDGQGGWTEVSLTDRSAYEYQLLIGRNFLTGRAVVDVSLMHHQGSKR